MIWVYFSTLNIATTNGCLVLRDLGSLEYITPPVLVYDFHLMDQVAHFQLSCHQSSLKEGDRHTSPFKYLSFQIKHTISAYIPNAVR